MSDQNNSGAKGAGPKTPDVAAQQAKYPFHKRFVRKAIKIRVEVERFQEALASSSVNISPSGICFKIDEPLEQGERMRVLLYVPRGKEVEILKVQARMVWQEPQDEGWRVGAAFEQFAPGDERRIRAWLIELS
ncbi:MAG: PilZ domain-containing protein [Deltaproteobacteria bacterium]|nr:PilZ domain-containing protein [Deltaproteobacteria bacterium]